MKKVGFLTLIALTLFLTSSALAGPLMPALPSDFVAGEAEMLRGGSVSAYVDWIVLGPGMGGAGSGVDSLILDIFTPTVYGAVDIVPMDLWVYAYQVEGVKAGVSNFKVDVPDLTTITAVGIFGSLSGGELDAAGYGHSSGVFANLATEHEAVVGSPVGILAATPGTGSFTWQFVPSNTAFGFNVADKRSEILFFVANKPATYRFSSVDDSGSAGFPAEGLLPSPVPEPTSLLLLATGLLGLRFGTGSWRRRQRR